MLRELYAENFALINKITLVFEDGFNVISGETGAGKSLILDAVSLLMGGRAQEHFIREGADKCFVQGSFPSPWPEEAEKLLAENAFAPDEDMLILSREYTRGGRNFCRLNGRAAPLSLLRQLGRILINIHGQMEHTLLLQEHTQGAVLDDFGGGDIIGQKAVLRDVFARLESLKSDMHAYENEKMERARNISRLEFELNEIEKARLSREEAVSLEKEKKRLIHAEKLLEAAKTGQENAARAMDAVFKAVAAFRKTASLDDSAESVNERLQDIYYNLEDIVSAIRDYLESISVNPSRLDDIERRLGEIRGVCRKYGPEIADALAYGEKAAAELNRLRALEINGAYFREEYEKHLRVYNDIAAGLSALRHKAGEGLALAVNSELKLLYMENAALKVEFKPSGISENGVEAAVFMIRANPGESFQPLNKIASGGELARIVLALKVVLAQGDNVPSLIFDEADSGLGGKAISAVARKMAFVSRECQVLCVTHSPIMAAAAGHHIYIYKELSAGRAVIMAQAIYDEDREKEIARMLAGEKIDGAAIAQAKNMLARQKL
jgi:DNA repair protein RecN (Recombination protein N)